VHKGNSELLLIEMDKVPQKVHIAPMGIEEKKYAEDIL